MKSTIFFCAGLLATMFIFSGTSTLEARNHHRHHSGSRTQVNVNVGPTYAQGPNTYIVRPAYPQPVYVYPSYYDQVIVYPSPAYQEVVAVPVQPAPRISLFSLGLNFFR